MSHRDKLPKRQSTNGDDPDEGDLGDDEERRARASVAQWEAQRTVPVDRDGCHVPDGRRAQQYVHCSPNDARLGAQRKMSTCTRVERIQIAYPMILFNSTLQLLMPGF